MSATEIVEHFNKAFGNLDLLKIYMVTGVTDISKSHEMLTKLSKNASNTDAEKVMFETALKALGRIAVKRVLLTDILYSSLNVGDEAMKAEPEAQVIAMFPKLEETLDRVRHLLKSGAFSSDAYKGATDILNATVRQGKVVDMTGNLVTWTVDETNIFLEAFEKAEKKESKKVDFGTVYTLASELVKNGKTADEVEAGIKEFVLNKIVGSRDEKNDVLIKDDSIFKDFYSRMVSAYVIQALSKKTVDEDQSKTEAAITGRIDKEIKPILATLDKDEKEKSYVGPMKALMAIYESFGKTINLPDAGKAIADLAEKVAPNLFKRHAETTKVNLPIDKTAVRTKENNPVTEVYDESHNIRESNKELWEEVKDYQSLEQLYNKGVELSKAGKWRDAISMCIILIESGKIKENDKSTEPLKWDADEVKLWYYNNVEMTVSGADQANKSAETIDVHAEVVDDKKDKSNELIGPVPKAGFTEVKESQVSKLLKNREELKSKYAFKFVKFPANTRTDRTISFEVLDATVEQEPELIGTEANITKLMDIQRDVLVEKHNAVKLVRQDIMTRLNTCYEVTHGEVKGLTAALEKEATELRKAAHKEKVAAVNTEKSAETTIDESIKDDEDGTVYYKELKVGALVEEKKDGKKQPIEDGEWTIPDEKNIDQTCVTKNGIIVSMEKEVGDVSETAQPASTELQASVLDTPIEQANSDSQNKGTIPLADKPAAVKSEEKTKEVATKIADAGQSATENTAGDTSVNSNKADETKKESASTTPDSKGQNDADAAQNRRASSSTSYAGFDEILKSKTKVDFHKAIYEKAASFKDIKEGKKAIFDVIDKARSDGHWKRYHVKGFKNSPTIDVLSMIDKAVEAGLQLAASPGKNLAG